MGVRTKQLVIWAAVVLVPVTLGGAAAIGYYAWLNRTRTFDQSSPDAVLREALRLVEAGEPEFLPDLIYADSPEFRSVLNRLGRLLGEMQRLGKSVQRRFPNDVANLMDRAKGSAAGKEATSLLSSLGPPRGDMSAAERKEREQAFQALSQRLFADPFAVLRENASRLTVARVSDVSAVIQLDGQAALGGVFTMRLEGGRWYIVLPTRLPGAAQFMPETKNEWSIIGSLMRVAENLMIDLRKEIDGGKIGTPDRLAERAGEMVFAPGAMVALVYAKEMDVRGRRGRAMGDLRRKQTEWLNRAADGGADAVTLRRLLEALNSAVAIEDLDKKVRADSARRMNDAEPGKPLPRQVPDFSAMSVDQVQAMMQGWLKDAGIAIDLGSLPTTEAIDAAAKQLAAPKAGSLAPSRRKQ